VVAPASAAPPAPTTDARAAGYTRETFRGKAAHALDAARVHALTDFVETARTQLSIPGVAVSLFTTDSVIFEGGFGVREIGKSAPVDADTLFMIASNTKPLSTLLLATLVDEGKFTWDTKVTRVYPAFKLSDADLTSRVTMKQLVCMCTGFPREEDAEWLLELKGSSPKSFMDRLGTMKSTRGFGEAFQYTDLLPAAAGFIGGAVLYPQRELDAAYDEAMKTRVFGPLGMTSTTFDFAQALRKNHASPHALRSSMRMPWFRFRRWSMSCWNCPSVDSRRPTLVQRRVAMCAGSRGFNRIAPSPFLVSQV